MVTVNIQYCGYVCEIETQFGNASSQFGTAEIITILQTNNMFRTWIGDEGTTNTSRQLSKYLKPSFLVTHWRSSDRKMPVLRETLKYPSTESSYPRKKLYVVLWTWILSLTHPVKQTQGDGFWYDDKTKYDNVFNVIEKAGVVSKVSNEEIETPAVSSCTIL